jgi:hypothetical protein
MRRDFTLSWFFIALSALATVAASYMAGFELTSQGLDLDTGISIFIALAFLALTVRGLLVRLGALRS